MDRRGPSGTVTFVFTDIEGSTALWDVAPVAMAAALARHDEIVLDAVAAEGGFTFASGGDGFAAAFASASAGVRAAAAIQVAVAAEAWPVDAVIRVRIGVHSGTADERMGNYFGATVNRASRVASAGHGGQVIASGSTVALLEDDGWEAVDVGRHRLEGFARAESLHRLVVPGVDDVTTPLRGAQRAGNLHGSRGPLVGRDDEVAAVASMLVAGSLTSVVGVGGVGKTRVAIRAAEVVADRFPDGCWLVELASVASPDDVPAATAAALGITNTSQIDVPAVVDALRSQRRLVVLDNCEHVLDEVVDLVRELTDGCAGVAVLTTSREALGVPDERVVPLRPLRTAGSEAMSDAARLFCERARGALGDFEPDELERAVVERICRRLDGLPLAIELAGSRLPTMTLGELDARLDERFGLLTRRRGAIERHQSLRTAVAWSYDHLDDDEQLVFDALSVFSGGFDIAAARAVTGGAALAADVDDIVASLAAKSMIGVDRTPAGTRLRLLETLRQWGEERLHERGTASEVHRRHLAHFVAWAANADEGVRGSDEVRWHRAFDDEWHNIRSALRWACETTDSDAAASLLDHVLWWALLRVRTEVADWIATVLDLPGNADAAVRPKAAAIAAVFASVRGDHDLALQLLAEATADEARLGTVEPWVPMVVATIPTTLQRQLDGALAGQRRSEQSSFLHVVSSAQEATLRALMLHADEDVEAHWSSEVRRIREVVTYAEAYANPGIRSHATMALGFALALRDPMAAIEQLERSLEDAVAVDVEFSTMQTRQHLAEAYHQVGRHLDALSILLPAAQRYLHTGAEAYAWFAITFAVPALVSVGEGAFAADLLDAADRHGLALNAHERAATLIDADRAARERAATVRPAQLSLADVLRHLQVTIDRLTDDGTARDPAVATT